MVNILKNAVEAIASREAGGDDRPGRIDITVAADDERVRLSVADNGIGLPPEHRHRLTEPYVTTRAKGTGLGLAIVRKIVEDHGGEITLRDRDDDVQGAEVCLSVPLRQRQPRDIDVEPEDEQERIADRA